MTFTVRARTLVAGTLAVVALVATGAVAGATLAPRVIAPATAFPDVPPNAFYTAAVQWAADNGITTGVGSTGLFKPDDPVTRGQMATFLERLASTEVTLSHGTGGLIANAFAGSPSTIDNLAGNTRLVGTGGVQMDLTGPESRNGVTYGLTSYRYCLTSVSGLTVDSTSAWSPGGTAPEDGTNRTAAGCYTVEADLEGPITLYWFVTGAGSLRLSGVTSTWVPIDELDLTTTALEPTASDPSGL